MILCAEIRYCLGGEAVHTDAYQDLRRVYRAFIARYTIWPTFAFKQLDYMYKQGPNERKGLFPEVRKSGFAIFGRALSTGPQYLYALN